MANPPHPQHRCVFVGNIPYDAKEEQLKEICEEVGPVVSFRLVIDRETGKPKGYGFCEYKDEETALSARRNLQGYEINGRQLRVDFAENDKNTDKGREQGRGGPGMVASVENQKQFGGPAVLGDSSLHQPIGVSAAMTAGTVLAQTIGATQIGNHTNMNNQPSVASDPITLHLAKMSRHQLIEVVSEMKAMATQNKEQARQLLLACSPMAKAILQALILLELAPSAMLQMPNIKQAPTPVLQPSAQDGVPSQLSATQNLLGFPSNLPNKVQYNALDNAVSAIRPVSMLNNQQAIVSQFPLQPHSQGPLLIHQSQFLQPGNLNVPLMRPQSQGNFSLRPQGQVATSSYMQQVQNPQFQQLGPVNQGPQHVAPFLSGVPDDISKDPRKQVMGDSIDSMAHPSKLARMNDGRPMPSSMAEGSSQPEIQAVQAPLPPDVESVLLQQVLSLPPEQVRLLPPDQQQQIIQLQQMYRQTS